MAQATDRELAKIVQLLKTENKIFRCRLPDRILTTSEERQKLIRFANEIGRKAANFITIVKPNTFLRWMNGESKSKRSAARRNPGRPKTVGEIEQIIVRLAKENTTWGYYRILGEMMKLVDKSVCKTTVKNILIRNGLKPSPERGEKTWAEFLKQHAESLWACDFFSKKILTPKGFVDCFALFFIHIATRKVHFCGVTSNPTSAWVTQQARNFVMATDDSSNRPKMLLRDFDTKFSKEFTAVLDDEGIQTVKAGPMKPNLNAFAERFVQSIKLEALNNFLILGEKHFRYLCTEYCAHHQVERPHQSLGNIPPITEKRRPKINTDEAIVFTPRLGGLLKHYHRKAA